RPGRMLAAGAATEIATGQQDRGALVARLVQHEVWVGLAAGGVLAGLAFVQVAPLIEQVGAKAGLADRLEELLGNDGVGVDILAVHGGHEALVKGELLHGVGELFGYFFDLLAGPFKPASGGITGAFQAAAGGVCGPPDASLGRTRSALDATAGSSGRSPDASTGGAHRAVHAALRGFCGAFDTPTSCLAGVVHVPLDSGQRL